MAHDQNNDKASIMYFTKYAEQTRIKCDFELFPTHYTEPLAFTSRHLKHMPISFLSGMWWKYSTETTHKGSCCISGVLCVSKFTKGGYL